MANNTDNNNNGQPADNWQQILENEELWQQITNHPRLETLKSENTIARLKELTELRRAAEREKAAAESQLAAAEQSKLSDMEKLQQQMDGIQAQFKESQHALQQAERQRMQLQVAADVGLPPALAARLVGDTIEDMQKDAAHLQPLLRPTTPGNPPPASRQAPGAAFTADQLNNPQFVRENKEKIMAAAARGELE